MQWEAPLLLQSFPPVYRKNQAALFIEGGCFYDPPLMPDFIISWKPVAFIISGRWQGRHAYARQKT
ncbi:Hypothetical protein GbCGDNIH2_0083 [Granulibacter bethesdensis]|uniref:Uncharacterized protein n=1 Tax=Granulibacter bethesdensis (strain ATCC BAA-1260 / CGDNIH1) TaxID=391165 RepID=Q0BW21_GRABC|nr:Hypothetical protein GbCGDNIH1_0083 [Granulibacter bethesdensis CGDNIH1]APG30583.1 Hypothetical protein GbCGDNIH2_0083 [Granulibacter bethesdensis]APG31101.1 Hypothetical protein GbCGDNIH4_0083 [Granulibacter bethesdensis CGDNIH4]APH50749.1 Hypothetical protein GbCGDNIH5_0083 [Granulibacter bethesdensis]APH63444.1 Hypothetical protein GbCGDNIH1I4_0083 [Granulibacter bethesdensis]